MIVKLSDFLAAMKYAWRAVSPGDFVSNFRFISFESFAGLKILRLRAFNGTLGVEVDVPTRNPDAFKPFVVDADRLMRYLQSFDAADSRAVELTLEKSRCVFSFQKAGKIALTPAQLKTPFWKAPDEQGVDWCLTMDKKFRESCKLVLSIAGLDTARLVTQGIFMEGSRLHVTSGAAIGESTAKAKFSKPMAMVYDFVRILVEIGTDIEVGTGKNFVVAKTGTVKFVQSLFRCPAPDFDSMLKNYRKPQAAVTVNLKEFVEKFRRIGNMTDQQNRGVKLVFKAGMLRFGFEDSEVHVREAITYKGNYDGEILLNFAYIKGYLDELVARPLKQLQLGFIGAGKGLVFRIAEPFVLVLLPMVKL